ncbi:MAG: stage II sporulation protein M [Chloroflexota bacterium]
MSFVGQFRNGVVGYLRANTGVYVFCIVIFTVGACFGALAIRALSAVQKAELIDYLQVFLRGLANTGEPVAGAAVLQQALATHWKTAGFIWLLGLTVIGLPAVALVVFTRGFVIGFTVGFLAEQLGYKGVLFALFSVLPQNLLAVPAILVVGASALSFSLLLVGARMQRRRFQFLEEFAGYTAIVAVACVALAGAGLVEAFIAPVFIRLFAGTIA